MANGGTIQFGIKYNVDQSGLNNAKKALQEISNMSAKAFASKTGLGLQEATQELNKIKQTVKEVEQAMNSAFNADLGTMNISKLGSNLKNLGLDRVYKDLSKTGEVGQRAFRNLVTQSTAFNQQIKRSNRLLNDFSKTMANTVKWGITSSIMNTFTGSVERAYGYVKNLDTSLNDIRIVTNQSAEEMDKFAVKANNAAKALGSSTLDYTKASLIYYQQGLSEQEVEARANVTLKAANVTGQSGEAVSEQLTAIWNGYKVSAEEAEVYIDKVSAVAAATAADLEELSTGMSKVASAANAMGVDVDQLNAQLATIVSVTRQAPESVGTALKTIYARMSDLKIGGTDEDGLGLGDVSGTMESMGIEVLDATGNLRDMGNVIEDVAAKWDTWTEAQQTAMAQVMAGKRQYNNLVALFENWDMYTDALETSEGAAGTLAQQNEIYLESVEAHLQQLSTATEDAYDSMFNADSFKSLIDLGTGLVTIFGDFIDAIGGGGTAFTALGGIATRVMSKEISRGISDTITNFKNLKDNAQKAKEQLELGNVYKQISEENPEMDNLTKRIINITDTTNQLAAKGIISEEEEERIKSYNQQLSELDERYKTLKQQRDNIQSDQKLIEEDKAFTDALLGGEGIDWEKLGPTQNIKEQQEKTAYLAEVQQKLAEETKGYADYSIAIDSASKKVEDFLRTRERFLETESNDAFDDVFKDLFEDSDSVVAQLEKFSEGGFGLFGETINTELISEGTRAQLEQAQEEYSNFMAEHADDVNLVHSDEAMKKITNLTNALKEAKAEADSIVETAQNTVDQIANGTEAEIIQELNQVDDAIDDVTKKTGNLNETLNQEVEKFSLDNTIDQFVDMGGAILECISAYQMLAGLGDIWSDDSLTDGEKTIKTITAITTALILLGSNIPSILTGFTALKTSLISTGAIAAGTAGPLAVAGGALKAFGASIYAALGPVGLVIGAIVALTGVVVAIVSTFESAEEKTQRLADDANSLANSANQAETELANLKSTLDSFNENNKTLENLVKGTDEWKEKLKETNAQAQELIGKYSWLAENAEIDEDGRIVLNQKDLEELKKQETEKVENAQNYANLGKIIKNQDELKNYQNKQVGAAQDIFTWDMGAGTIASSETQDLIKAIQVRGESAIYDKEFLKQWAVTNTTSGRYYEQWKDNSELDALEYERFLDEFVNSVQSSAEYFTNAINESAAVQKENSLYFEQVVSEVAEDLNKTTFTEAEEGIKDAVVSSIQNRLDDEEKLKQTQAYKDISSKSDEEIKKIYADQTAGLYYDESSKKFYTNDSKKEEVTDVIDVETMKSIIGLQEAIKTEVESIDKIIQNIQNLSDSMGTLGDFAYTFMGGKVGDFSKASYSQIQEGKDRIFSDKDFSPEELSDLGFDSVEELNAAYKKSIDNYMEEISRLKQELPKSVQNIFDDFSSLTLPDFQVLTDSLAKSFKYGGEEGLQQYTAILDQIPEASVSQFNQIVNSIDWSSALAINDFSKALKNNGIYLDENSQAFKDFTHSQVQAGYRTSDYTDILTNLQSTLGDIHSLIGDIKIGDILSVEDYERLISYNKELEKYFMMNSTGGYTFVGGEGSEDIYKQTIDGITNVSMAEAKKEAARRSEAAEGLGDLKLSQVDEKGRRAEFGSWSAEKKRLAAQAAGWSEEEVNNLMQKIGKNAYSYNDEGINELFAAIDKNYSNYQNKLYETQKLEEIVTDAQIDNLEELESLYAQGQISFDTYSKKRQLLLQKDSEAIELSAEEWDAYTEELKKTYPELAKYDTATKEIALRHKELNVGLINLISNWSKYDKLMQSDSAADRAEGYRQAKTDLKQVTGVDVSDEFIDQNRELIVDVVVEGDYSKLDELTAKAVAAQLETENLEKTAQDLNIDIDDSSFKEFETSAQQLSTYLTGTWLDDINNLKPGDKLPEQFRGILSEMLQDSAEMLPKIIQWLSALGFEFNTGIEKDSSVFSNIADAMAYQGMKNSGNQEGAEALLNQRWSEAVANKIKEQEDLLNDTVFGGDQESAVETTEAEETREQATGKDKDKSKDTAELKEYNDELEVEIDRYHDVNVELQLVENSLKKLQAQEDKLVGQDFINNLAEQNKLLEDQIHWLEEKIKLKKKEAAELRADLTAAGASFDADGKLLNYFDLLGGEMDKVTSQQEAYNRAVDEINRTKDFDEDNAEKIAAEAAMKEAEKNLSDAQELFNQIKELIEQYEQIVHQDIPDLESQKQDSQDEIIANQIEAFNYSIDIQLDLDNAQRQWNEFKHKVLEGGDRFSLFGDDILGDANLLLENLKTYPKSISDVTTHLNTITSEINTIAGGGNGAIYGDNVKAAIEDAQKYQEALMENLEAIEDAYLEIQQLYLDMLDAAQDAFDDHIASFEAINDVLEHNISLVEKLRGEDAYEEMGRYYEAQEQNNNDKLRFLREQVEFWESQMGEEEYGSEAWQKAKENWISATNELNSAVEESLDVIIAKYQNSISQIMSDLTDSLTGNNLGLDYLEEEWNLINENADAYLDKINSMFAIDELQGKYTDAINNTDSLEVQERLTKIMNEQVAALEEKGKLTEYDVERANLLYEIELKKIALEEAQQNKSKMRLRRDSQGNYSYQFTADEDAIAQTQSELDKLQNSLYNLDKEAYRNNLNEVYDIYAEFQDRLKELYADQTLSDEEREAQREMLVQQYGERINGLVAENEVIRTNLYDSTFQELARMYDTDIEHFQNMSQAEQDLLMQEMVPQWDTGIQTMIDKISADGGFGPTVSETIDQLKEKNQEYQEDLRAMADAAEIDLERIASGYDRSYESINQLIDQNSEVIAMWDEQIAKLGQVKDEVEQLVADMTDLAAVAAAAMQNSNDAIKNAQKVKDSLEQIVKEDEQQEKPQTNTDSTPAADTGTDDKPKDEPKEPKVGDTVTLESSTVWGSSSGAAPVKTPWAGKQVKIGKIQSGADYPIHVIAPDGSQSEQMDWIGWIKKSHLKGFDTGGYTGMWGNKEGKVAMLHEKELVLNKTDTENILAAVDIVRTISGVIDNLERKVSARMFDLSNLNIPQYAPPIQDAQTIEQQVHIDATFPNVQNSNEIEEAFNNLVNIASQHAFKTKR